MMPGPGDVARNLAAVRDRIAAAAHRAGRSPDDVTLIGVTKTVEPDRIRAACAAGLGDIGENRVQEAESKFPHIEGIDVRRHLIGHLQSNKAKKAVALFGSVHSVDTAAIARRLARLAEERGAPIDVLIQVDLGHEPTKHGVDAGACADLAAECAALGFLNLRGLMTIPPLCDDPEKARPWFARLRGLRDAIARAGPALPDLSMGMTGDFEVAVEEGATMIRVGRAIFGERPHIG